MTEVARERLVSERERSVRRVRELDADYRQLLDSAWATNVDDEHDPEGATTAFERSHLATVLAQAKETLAELDAALDRLDAGRYGVCERCGTAIAPARLGARPTARTCVSC
ncbi:TraR/DksA family transcriptional regulator [Nocardioides insulae]|uniref:TraR/DksA family transcriptional regulator n=1 Tax=Nocardioides insulae TaxID=394734 RepID=UPI0003FBBE5B|nr:TraR/DksA family transcriptional regulator [Nocardioides insulae]